jgi:hypothetical protein
LSTLLAQKQQLFTQGGFMALSGVHKATIVSFIASAAIPSYCQLKGLALTTAIKTATVAFGALGALLLFVGLYLNYRAAKAALSTAGTDPISSADDQPSVSSASGSKPPATNAPLERAPPATPKPAETETALLVTPNPASSGRSAATPGTPSSPFSELDTNPNRLSGDLPNPDSTSTHRPFSTQLMRQSLPGSPAGSGANSLEPSRAASASTTPISVALENETARVIQNVFHSPISEPGSSDQPPAPALATAAAPTPPVSPAITISTAVPQLPADKASVAAAPAALLPATTASAAESPKAPSAHTELPAPPELAVPPVPVVTSAAPSAPEAPAAPGAPEAPLSFSASEPGAWKKQAAAKPSEGSSPAPKKPVAPSGDSSGFLAELQKRQAKKQASPASAASAAAAGAKSSLTIKSFTPKKPKGRVTPAQKAAKAAEQTAKAQVKK